MTKRPSALRGDDVYVVEAVRTPVGRGHPDKGVYRDTHPNELLGACYDEVLLRSEVPPGEVGDVVIGCTAPFGEQSRNIARNAWLQAGFPPEVPATTLDRRCGSAQTAIAMGAGLVATGTHDVVLAGGVEHMGHVPIDSPLKIMELYGDPWPQPLRDRYSFVHQGESAELIAERWGISRLEMEELAVRSHRLAQQATDEGRFGAEMVPMKIDGQVLDRDQGIRPGASLEDLAELGTPFRGEGGRITAATSSQISDGAALVMLASGEAVRGYGLRPLARLLDQTTVGVDPIIMLTGPIPATRRMLKRNRMDIGDIDLFEVNEAFASVVLAWERELEPDMDRVNVNGGALALGHPVGATGARLVATLLHEMGRREAEVGLVTMCCGGGFGTATLFERVAS